VETDDLVKDFGRPADNKSYRYSGRKHLQAIPHGEVAFNQMTTIDFYAEFAQVDMDSDELACVITDTADEGDEHVRIYVSPVRQVEDEVDDPPGEMAHTRNHELVSEFVGEFLFDQ